jgi:hypothetical protein
MSFVLVVHRHHLLTVLSRYPLKAPRERICYNPLLIAGQVNQDKAPGGVEIIFATLINDAQVPV